MIWTMIIFIALLVWSKSTCSLIIDIFKILLSPKLLFPILLIIFYSIFISYFIIKLPLWKNTYIKDIIFCIFLAGIPLHFKSLDKKNDLHYFKNIIWNSINVTAMLDFITSSFTFSLLMELFLTLVMSVLTVSEVYSEGKEEYFKVNRVLKNIIRGLSLCILISTITNIYKTYPNLGYMDLLYSFFIPIIFVIAYIPSMYIISLYSKYEQVFGRMRFKSDNFKDRKIKEFFVFLKCNFSYKKISYFMPYTQKLYTTIPKDDFKKLLNDFEADYKNKEKIKSD